jgi:lysyl-tRNA synthetase class I
MIIYRKNNEGLIEEVNVAEYIMNTYTEEEFNLKLEKEKEEVKKAEDMKQQFIEQKQEIIDTLETAKVELDIKDTVVEPVSTLEELITP